MKTAFVNELKIGQKLEAEHFLLSDFRSAKTKKGDTYYRLELADKTGRIPAVMWPDNIQNAERNIFNVGDVLSIDASVEDLRGMLQLDIVRAAKAKEYDDGDFQETTGKDIKDLWRKVEDTIDTIENKWIKELLQDIFSDKDIVEKFKKYPAAKTIHHQFIGGLLEHVSEMLSISEILCQYYPEADSDIVKAAVLLHDIGKLQEYTQAGIGYDRTVEGRLIGHVVLGVEFVNSRLRDGFPKDLKMKINHIILSHHGQLEFGSPVVPKTIEAAIVRSADDASSKVRQYQKYLKAHEGSDEEFSNYDQFIETEVYLK
ncbi:HD domain-containing protein [Candidatus Dojkabacteria bacterium]|nr:HD domain-containing protein [Candidatus Dojkabacteria bacterium]